MKFSQLICALYFFTFYGTCYSQGVWTWVHGNSTINQATITGPIGVSNSTNKPGGRYGSAQWTDNQGNLWMYSGGATWNTNYTIMWKYDPLLNQWTPMSNPGSNTPVYNTQGVASPTTSPGSNFVSLNWTDNDGNLWLYGGIVQTASAASSDLWKYDVVTNQWTWVMGSGNFGSVPAPTVYGTTGVPNPSNTPGARGETTCAWKDASGDLWFFGGDGYLMGRNEVWKYNIASNQWTFMKGESNLAIVANNVYGTQGVSAPTNTPSGRWAWAKWKDLGGNFWLFGGQGEMMGNMTNDMWRYNPTTNAWTWMSGTNIPNHTGTYGTQCVPSVTNVPPSRGENRATWTDQCGNFWMFGGASTPQGGNFYNDLWRFNPNTLEWTWVSGSNLPGQIGTYGTLGVPNPANRPGARFSSSSWTTEKGFWLFGGAAVVGNVYNEYSDLWLYKPDTVVANFAFSDSCLDVNFTDLSTTGCNNILSWEWDFGDGSSSTNQNPTHTYPANGSYQVSLIVKNCTSDSDTIIQTINVNCGFSIGLISDTLCIGDCRDLIVTSNSNPDSVTFYWDNGIMSNNDTVNVCPINNTTYTVLGVNAAGDSATTTATLTVITPPIVDLGNDTIFCFGSVLLDAGNPGATYFWQDGSSSQTLLATTSGMYTVVVNNGWCTVTDTINITINGPIIDLGPDIVSCTPNALLDPGPSGLSYLWQDGTINQTFLAADTGTYFVSVTDISTGCTASDTLVISLPTIVVDLGPDTVICDGTQVTFDSGNTGLNHLWSDNSTQQTLVVNQSGTYSVIVSDGLCLAHDTIQLIVENSISSFDVSDTVGCVGVDVNFLDLSTSSSLITGWLWTFGDNTTSSVQNPTHYYNQSGVYPVTLQVTTINGCISDTSKSITIEVYDQPQAAFSYTPQTVEVNTEVQFQDLSINASVWQWEFGDGSSSSLQHPSHTYLNLDDFQVTLVVSNNQCIDSAQATLIVEEGLIFFVPNAFTPDDDTHNQIFKPVFTSGFDPYRYHLAIFNRWGELIFESYNSEIGWDGTYSGTLMQDGIFTWKIEFGGKNNAEMYLYTGHVSILK